MKARRPAFEVGDEVESIVGSLKNPKPGMRGVVTGVWPSGIGWGDPGPSYTVRWASGVQSNIRGRMVRKPLDTGNIEGAK